MEIEDGAGRRSKAWKRMMYPTKKDKKKIDEVLYKEVNLIWHFLNKFGYENNGKHAPKHLFHQT